MAKADRELMDKDILDIQGAAAVLGVSKRTIYKLVSEKRIPAAKVGKEWRFSRRKLIEWVAAGAGKLQPDSLAELLRGANVRASTRGVEGGKR